MSCICSDCFSNKCCVQSFRPMIKMASNPERYDRNTTNLYQDQPYGTQNNLYSTMRLGYASGSNKSIKQDLEKGDLNLSPNKSSQKRISSLGVIVSPHSNGSKQTIDTLSKPQEVSKGRTRHVTSITTIDQKEEFQMLRPSIYYDINKRQPIQLTSTLLTSLLQNLILNNNEELVYERIEKSEYDHLRENFKKGKWQDANFVRQQIFEAIISLKWRSLYQIFADKEIVMFEDRAKATDIYQGKVGDCYFLSAVAALARNPARIYSLFPEGKINPNGIFMARMIFKGVKQEVTVDSYFPQIIDKDDHDKPTELLGCRPNTNSQQIEVYTMILEKCWAKLWKSYEKIHGGYPHQALHALTGAVTKNYKLQKYKNNHEKNMAFFYRVLKFHKSGFVMCAGTDSTVQAISDKIIKKCIDIYPSHIYCVEKILKKNGEELVKLYNPWGKNTIMNAENGQEKEMGGEITLTWQQFTKEFMYLTVCKVYDNAHYLYEEMDFKPRQLKFIELTIHDKTASYLSVTVSETDKKEEANAYNPYLNLTYIVVKERDEENGTFQLLVIKNFSMYSDHYMELVDLQPGKYFIAVYISNTEIKERLTFAIYSEATFGFAQKKADSSFKSNFIYKIMHAYDKKLQLNSAKNRKKAESIIKIGQTEGSWVSFNMMINKSSFGYMLGHVDNEAKGFRLQFGGRQLYDIGVRVLPQFNKQKQIRMEVKPGSQSLIVFVIEDINKYLGQIATLKELHDSFRFDIKRF